MASDFVCPLPTVASVEDWVKRGDDGKNCPPCLITPLASWYVGILEENGKAELAKSLQNAYEGGDILTIAKEMDKIKASVGGELKKTLEDFDCEAQVFEED